jgi:hypothetical protein
LFSSLFYVQKKILSNSFADNKKMETFYMKPSSEESRRYKSPLMGSDYGLLFVMEVPICLAWKTKQIDPEVLKKGLQRTLDIFPIAASRLVPKQRLLSPISRVAFSNLIFSNVGSKGALLEVERVDESMPDEAAPSKSWNKYFVKHTFRRIAEPFGVPLLAARLTLFGNSGCTLCVSVSHVLGDGAAIHHLLSTWSFCCGQAIGSEILLPSKAPSPPVLEREIPLIDKWKKNPTARSGRVSKSRTVRAGAVLLTHLKVDRVQDFRLDTSGLSEIKQTLSEKIEKPKWISSYEAIMSVLLRALATADRRKQLSCRAIVNVRGRTTLFHPDYFGNALSYHKFTFENKGEVAETAFAFHESLRTGIQDSANLEHPHLEAEHVKYKGKLSNIWDRARWTQPFFASVLEGEPIINSWIGFDFFNMDFGLSGVKPDLLRVATSFRNHRHIHLYPISPNGDIAIRVQLPAHTMRAFKKALKGTKLGSLLLEEEAIRATSVMPNKSDNASTRA